MCDLTKKSSHGLLPSLKPTDLRAYPSVSTLGIVLGPLELADNRQRRPILRRLSHGAILDCWTYILSKDLLLANVPVALALSLSSDSKQIQDKVKMCMQVAQISKYFITLHRGQKLSDKGSSDIAHAIPQESTSPLRRP